MTAHVSTPGIGTNGLMLEAVSGDLAFADGVVTVTALNATQPDGSFTASGSWRLQDSSLTASISARNLAMTVMEHGGSGLEEVGRLDGISLDADISGSAARPDGVVSLEIGSAAFDEVAVNGLKARVEATAGVARLTADAPNDGVSIDGRLTLDTPRPFEGRVTLTRADVATLAQLAGLADEYVKDLAVSRTPPWTCPERFKTLPTSLSIWR